MMSSDGLWIVWTSRVTLTQRKWHDNRILIDHQAIAVFARRSGELVAKFEHYMSDSTRSTSLVIFSSLGVDGGCSRCSYPLLDIDVI